MGEIHDPAFRNAWGAFAAGILESGPVDLPPERAWQRVVDRLRELVADAEALPDLETLRRWAASWATANLPPEILLRRRWF